MPIKVTCDCGKVTMVPDAYAGRTGKCPACKQPVKVPMLEAVEVAEAAQPAARQVPVAQAPQVRRAPQAAPPPPAPEPEYEPEAQHSGEPAGDEMPQGEATHDYGVTESAPPPLEYATPGAGGGIIAPPPSDAIHLPTMIPEKLRQPNCPPLFLVLSTAGSDIQAKFDASPVLVSFVETLAKKLKKKFDVRLDPPTPGEAAPIVFVRVIQIQQGNRFLRWFLGWFGALFGASTCFEVDGNVQSPSKEPQPFTFKRKTAISFMFGGNSLTLLKWNAAGVAAKVAGLAKKAG